MVITVTREARASAQRLWEVISAPGYLERCHPYCESNPVSRWPGTDAHDSIHYYGGRVVERRFGHWLEGSGYDLTVVDPADVPQAEVRWRIEPVDDSACRLRIRLRLLALDHFPALKRWTFYQLVARRRMRSYLDAVVAGVVYHAETGEPVRRNQFGSHPWFSPPVEPAPKS